MGEGDRFARLLSRAAFDALERASDSALESEALFNPENQAALGFQKNKEGKDVHTYNHSRCLIFSGGRIILTT